MIESLLGLSGNICEILIWNTQFFDRLSIMETETENYKLLKYRVALVVCWNT